MGNRRKSMELQHQATPRSLANPSSQAHLTSCITLLSWMWVFRKSVLEVTNRQWRIDSDGCDNQVTKWAGLIRVHLPAAFTNGNHVVPKLLVSVYPGPRKHVKSVSDTINAHCHCQLDTPHQMKEVPADNCWNVIHDCTKTYMRVWPVCMLSISCCNDKI